MKEEKEIRANIAVTLQATKIIATGHGECLVNTEKALNVYSKIFSQKDHIHVTFIIVYYYNCSILLLVLIVDLLLCLMYTGKRICLAKQETLIQSLGWEDPLEKETATHSSILDWKIPWTEEPGGP